jgi:hypothetical protein
VQQAPAAAQREKEGAMAALGEEGGESGAKLVTEPYCASVPH